MKRSHAILLLVVLVAGIVVVVLRLPGAPQPDSKSTPPAPQPSDGATVAQALAPPPYSKSPYLNTGPDVKHIGSAACASCHPNNHKSYALTAHSKALEDVDPATEPPDATFDHKPSGRSYRIHRKNGQLWQEEVMRTSEGKEVARTDLPMRYRVGSGHFTRTYFVEVDGFLHEAPATWYESKHRWDASPGFEKPNQYGFQRPIRPECVACHAGQFEHADGKDHGLKFLERAIGCENCHGPGSLHQEFHRARKLAPGEADFTIVNPGKLSRPLLESVCASCHLSTNASADVRGRRLADYRPGLPLTDYRVHYNLRASDKMTVVGHVEQLRQSRCYQKSEMTCVTCHDPHAKSKPADPVSFYRQKCLDCHQTKPCSLAQEQRLKQSPADNCAACHMPRGDTDIQHVAFTHHRIGRHAKPAPEAHPPSTGEVPELVALDENPLLGEPDRRRNLGLAYNELVNGAKTLPERNAYQERARVNLRAAHAAGVRDPRTLALLGNYSVYAGDLASAARFANEAMATPGVDPISRGESLDVLATCERQNRNLPGAVGYLEQLVGVRRFGDDWMILGACYLRENKLDKAVAAFKQSLAIWPYRSAAHRGLADCYERLADAAGARVYRDRADWIERHVEAPSTPK